MSDLQAFLAIDAEGITWIDNAAARTRPRKRRGSALPRKAR
jgi:hypothetical protein